jgi:hypothetical protein
MFLRPLTVYPGSPTACSGIIFEVKRQLFKDMVKGKIFKMHYAIPLGSFAVGTWIAGTSVCTIALSQRLPERKLMAQVLVISNISLWFYFVHRAAENFCRFFGGKNEMS